VQLKPPGYALQHVNAARYEVHDEHLIFLDSKGGLVALFLMEMVESWHETNV
jgi:hypothetical protein